MPIEIPFARVATTRRAYPIAPVTLEFLLLRKTCVCSLSEAGATGVAQQPGLSAIRSVPIGTLTKCLVGETIGPGIPSPNRRRLP